MTSELQPEHVMKVLRNIPRDLRNWLRDTRGGSYDSPILLAGGFTRAIIANEEPSDIDLFAEADHDRLASGLGATLAAEITRTKNAITLVPPRGLPVQFITRWMFSDPVALINSFDFTVAQACIWHSAGMWRSICAERFYADLASKSLVYLAPDRKEDAGGSFLRMIRFLRKGYSISPEEASKVVARLISPLAGYTIDQPSIASQIARELRIVDPLNIVGGVAERAVAAFERTAGGLVEKLDDEDPF